MSPTLDPERGMALELAVSHVAGLDEAGRGALAGPVYAAAVIFPLDSPTLLDTLYQVNDSKQVSPRAREALMPLIMEQAAGYGIGSASAAVVDREGIIAATRLAMGAALAQLPAEAMLIDGRIRLPGHRLPQKSLVRGDSLSLSIAAASILAKVNRDAYMIDLDRRYPEYDFAAHKGYGTTVHREQLARLGPCPEHRRSFAPLRPSLL